MNITYKPDMEIKDLVYTPEKPMQIESYMNGFINSNHKKIPIIRTGLDSKDIFGAIKVRWSINRNNYTVEPGLYAIGKPDASSDIFVTANYKLSFDHLRKNLDSINGWVLVLDTKGINVWCAAGKGTFGTKELINRIEKTGLNEIVVHNRIIVPQLGAVGIAAHEVKKATGFRILYGPVRASDIKSFIKNKYKADDKMRLVNFNFKDRLILLPVDIVYNSKRYMLIILGAILLLSGLNNQGVIFENILQNGVKETSIALFAFLTGIVITPLLLPLLPFRSFALKGAFSGIVLTTFLVYLNLFGDNILSIASWSLIIISISSFFALGFTGSTTYTSLSGVKKEMKIAIPLYIISASLGAVGLIVSKIIL